MSNNIIFYFTGTGNSLKVAKNIGNSLENCDIVSMPSFCGNAIHAHYDRIGFVFPVYAFGIPNAVKKFITETNFQQSNAWHFAIATHGGVTGNSIPMLNKKLREKGISLSACFDIKMAASYICLCDMPANTESIQKKSQIKIDAIKKLIENKVSNKIKRTNPLFLVSELAAQSFPHMDKYYNVSAECSECGICYKVCPVNNIEMVNAHPVFRHTCEQCTACIQCCPNKALNYKNKTQNRRRYINPEISIGELLSR